MPKQSTTWKDELLAETLLSTIKVKDRTERVQSLTGKMNGVRRVLGIGPAGNRRREEKPSLIQLLLSPGRNNVALCEAIATSTKQRTLNDHNALHGDNGNGNNSSTNVKPAE